MKRFLVLLTLALGLALAAVPVALARADSGVTRLDVNPRTANALGDAGISVSAVKPAGGGGTQFVFPITGGKGDKIRHSGGLAFSGGGDRLVVKRFVVNLDRGILTAYVPAADARVPLLKLRGGKADLEGPAISLKNVRATLTPQAAAALNDTFGTDLFEGGLRIGKTNTNAVVG